MAKLDNYLERKTRALADRRAEWTANPESAVATVRASSKVAGITGARPTRMGEHTIVSDSGPGLAGHALGPTSPEMLLGALASCLVHTYLLQAVLLNIPLDDVSVEITAKIDYKPVIGMQPNVTPLLQDIIYSAHVESPAPADDIARMHEAVEASCAVLNTLRQPINVQRE
jgi:uncharacterized OsmC-like protein